MLGHALSFHSQTISHSITNNLLQSKQLIRSGNNTIRMNCGWTYCYQARSTHLTLLTYELTFANYSDVIKLSNPDASYTISNISLELDTVTNASLASQIRTEYMKSSILYDRILRSRNILLKDSDTSFSVDIISPSKSLKGVLLRFIKERSATRVIIDILKNFIPFITPR